VPVRGWLELVPVALIVALPQPVEHALAGAGDLGPFVFGQWVGADDRDAPPAVEDLLGGARSYSAPARAVAWANSASNCVHSWGDSWASAARTAGPDRSILVVAEVISPVSRPAGGCGRSARRPAVLDRLAVSSRLITAGRSDLGYPG
jgi:hypothetical protein